MESLRSPHSWALNFYRSIRLANGSFGLENESIIIRSGIREVFTPHIPVNEISHFLGVKMKQQGW